MKLISPLNFVTKLLHFGLRDQESAKKSYGPDILLGQFKIKRDNYLTQHIELAHEQIIAIESVTQQLSQSQVGHDERTTRITASICRTIIKRRSLIQVSKLVKQLMYSNFKGNLYTKNCLREENKFVGCSPDGLV